MLNQNIELLNSLYKNASMGTSAIDTILPKIENPNLKSELQTQLSNYTTECQNLKKQIYSMNGKPVDIGLISKTYADAGIVMSTAINSSSSHIAEMMIQGTTMGVIDITKALNENSDVQPELKNQAEGTIKKEQQYIDKLKAYL